MGVVIMGTAETQNYPKDEAYRDLNDSHEGDIKATELYELGKSSTLAFNAVTKELLPIFAKHLSDCQISVTRDRLELCASFRPLAELNLTETRRPAHRSIKHSQAAQTVSLQIEQPLTSGEPKRARFGRRVPIAIMAIAAVVLAGTLSGTSQKSGGALAQAESLNATHSIPGWASRIERTSLQGWVDIQTTFELRDATLRTALQVLRTNDRYPSAHRLHDLTRYPAQVKRAFSLIAGVQAESHPSLDAFAKLLGEHMSEAMRFPDEPPGNRYSLLEPQVFNNMVVLACIELLQRRQADPRVKEILAVLRRHQS
jgi:hypothetical protein